MTDSLVDADHRHDPSASEGPGLLASSYFWVGGLLSGEFWMVLALWAIELH
jgi:hypothetical protein